MIFILIKKYWISVSAVDVLSLRSLDHVSSFHWDFIGRGVVAAFKRSRRQACQYHSHKPFEKQTNIYDDEGGGQGC